MCERKSTLKGEPVKDELKFNFDADCDDVFEDPGAEPTVKQIIARFSTSETPKTKSTATDKMELAKKLYQGKLDLLKQDLADMETLLTTIPTDLDMAEGLADYTKVQLDRYLKQQEKYLEELVKRDLAEEAKVIEVSRAEVERKYALLKRRLISRRPRTPGIHTPSSGQPLAPPAATYQMNLPRRELPKFGGEVREWLSFWSSFEEIHDDVSIPDVDKFHYLLQSTIPESAARKVLTCFPISGANYMSALDALSERFGRKSMLIKVYIRDLLSLVIENSKQTTNQSFVELVTALTSQVSNLEQLGVKDDVCGLVLYPIVESCVPSNILMDWMKSADYDESLEKLLKFLKSEVRRTVEADLAHAPFTPATSVKQSKKGKGQQDIPTATELLHPQSKGKGDDKAAGHNCIFCTNPSHKSSECRSKLTVAERRAIVSVTPCCYVCLQKDHFVKKCKAKVACHFCHKRHFMMVCPLLEGVPAFKEEKDKKQTPTANTEEKKVEQNPPSTSSMASFAATPEVPLQTLLVKVYGPSGNKIVRAILDTGSQKSYITSQLAEELRMQPIGEEEVIHQLFGGSTSPAVTHKKIKMYIADVNGEDCCNFTVSCINKITGEISPPVMGPWIQEFRKLGVTFHDQKVYSPFIEVLIGNDIVPRLYTGRIRDLKYGPVAMETRWGWVLSGKLPIEQRKVNGSLLVTNCHVVNKPIQDLWTLDTLGIKDSAESETRDAIDRRTQLFFEENVKRDSTGRYTVLLPFIAGSQALLPSNYIIAEKRLKTMTKKLVADGYLEGYDEVFKGWEREGIIEEVEEDENEENIHYLPHRAVIKLTSTTTPIRPVFDASAKEKGKLSLNECLERGPNTLELIPSLLFKFRQNSIALTADVKKAFLQISVETEHRNFLRFLWWEGPSCNKIKVYRHTRVVFGVTSSPYLLGATIHHHLSKVPTGYEKIAAQLKNSFYVDNCLLSVKSYQQAEIFKKRAQELLLPAHFDLRGWEIGPSDEEKIIPVLGLLWNMKTDEIAVDVTASLSQLQCQPTQRNVLSLAHMLYDPIGFLSPFILQAKLILKECHRRKLGWDGELEKELSEQFMKWKAQISEIEKIKLPRHMLMDTCEDLQFHVFSDASACAYAVVIYLRLVVQGKTFIRFIQGKARVAPMKKISIPRLELLGCLIATRLYQSTPEIGDNKCVKTTFWTDSSTALTWIQSEGPWAVFVENRVKEIRINSEASRWRHIPGDQNPADLPSRGSSINKLKDSAFLHGPAWLALEEDKWPKSEVKINQEEVNEEKRKTIAAHLTPEKKEEFISQFLVFGNYDRILKVIGYIRRFVPMSRRATMSGGGNPGTRALTCEEMKLAETTLLRMVQQPFREDARKLANFKIKEDFYGILHVVTRLVSSEDSPFSEPIILPCHSEIVHLLIRQLHEKNQHAGVQILLGIIREKYWIINGRRTIRKIVHSCAKCRRHIVKRLVVEESPLPITRTEGKEAYSVSGVDMAGPLFLKGGGKVYIALFTCAKFRAVHLEVTRTLTTKGFITVLRRFVARRGRPTTIYSDNGLNFVGAERALSKIDWNEVAGYATLARIDWRFNPPASPWVGGFFERLIGVMKQLLRRVLGNKVVDIEELTTIIYEIEEVINNRPLTYASEDPNDPIPLTPNHFVRNRTLSYLPEVEVMDAQQLRKGYKRMQSLRESLRTRFRQEYLGLLIQHKKNQKTVSLSPGDVVLVELDNHKRLDWPLGIIVEGYPGKDGIIRTYRVKTKSGILTRAAQRLFPLEVK